MARPDVADRPNDKAPPQRNESVVADRCPGEKCTQRLNDRRVGLVFREPTDTADIDAVGVKALLTMGINEGISERELAPAALELDSPIATPNHVIAIRNSAMRPVAAAHGRIPPRCETRIAAQLRRAAQSREAYGSR